MQCSRRNWIYPSWGRLHALQVPTSNWGRWVVRYFPLIAIAGHSLIFMWVISGAGYYWDDFIILAKAGNHPFPMNFALAGYDGHSMPLAIITIAVVNYFFPYQWIYPVLIMTAMHAIFLSVMWKMCQALGGAIPRWRAGIAAVFIACTPLGFTSQSWWAASLNSLPLAIALCVNLWAAFAAHYSFKLTVSAVVTFILGVGFYEKAVIIPVIVLVVLGVNAQLSHSWKAFFRAYKHWAVWVILLIISLGYALWSWARITQIPGQRSVNQAVSLATSTVGAIFPSVLSGGPWLWERWIPAPPFAVPFQPGIFLTAIAGVALLWWAVRRKVIILFILAVSYVFLAHLVIYYVRSGANTSGLLAYSFRYAIDSVIIMGCVIVLALRYGDTTSRNQERISVPWCVTLTLFLAGSVISATIFRSVLVRNPSGEFIAGLKQEIAQGNTFFEQQLPLSILTPVPGTHDKISEVFASLHPRITPAQQRFRILTDAGRLISPHYAASRSIIPACQPRGIYALSGPLFSRPWLIEIHYPKEDKARKIVASLTEGPELTVELPAESTQMFIRLEGKGGVVQLEGLSCLSAGRVFVFT